MMVPSGGRILKASWVRQTDYERVGVSRCQHACRY